MEGSFSIEFKIVLITEACHLLHWIPILNFFSIGSMYFDNRRKKNNAIYSIEFQYLNFFLMNLVLVLQVCIGIVIWLTLINFGIGIGSNYEMG